MKKTDVAALLFQEMNDREMLDPAYYTAGKQSSIRYALALGIAPDVVARLYGMPVHNAK